MEQIIISGGFDNINSQQFRFLEEAAKAGPLHVLLWSDEAIQACSGKPPKFPQAERLYVAQANRHVQSVSVSGPLVSPDALPELPNLKPTTWVIEASGDTPAKRRFCQDSRINLRVITPPELKGFPAPPPLKRHGHQAKKVIVTGCYDWFHSGHVRFFEEAAEYGDLYVAVGNDANVENLKGPGHPMFKEDERRYIVGSIRYVTEALVTSGTGWLDAEPEIQRLKPDFYVVNHDGDKPEKSAYCAQNGIQYVVLKRTPKAGLPRRQSTDLRGF